MDIPLQRIPTVVGPSPAPPLPALRDRPKHSGEQPDAEERDERESDPEPEDENEEGQDSENAVAPAAQDEAGQKLDLTA